MSQCKKIETYLLQSQSAEQRTSFRRHLSSCVACRAEIENWKQIKTTLAEFISEDSRSRKQTLAELTPPVVRASQLQKQRVTPLRIAIPVATAAMIAAVLVWVARNEARSFGPETVSDTPGAITAQLVDLTGDKKASRRVAVGELVEVPSDRKLMVTADLDRLLVAPSSRFAVNSLESNSTSVLLVQGKVACAVRPRTLESEFVVQAPPYLIRALGTRFSVARQKPDRLVVQVAEGEVAVSVEGSVKQWHLFPGEQLELADKLSPQHGRADRQALIGLFFEFGDPVPDELIGPDGGELTDAQINMADSLAEEQSLVLARPTGKVPAEQDPLAKLEQWRLWVLQGRLAEAEQALSSHLTERPRDDEAWWVLASCQRKSGKWDQAVDSLYQVIRVGPPTRANQARFKAGVILQTRIGDHSRAVEMFDQYLSLSHSPSLRAEALNRLARSLLALESTERAAEVLRDLVERHGGTKAASRARRLLEEMKNSQKAE